MRKGQIMLSILLPLWPIVAAAQRRPDVGSTREGGRIHQDRQAKLTPHEKAVIRAVAEREKLKVSTIEKLTRRTGSIEGALRRLRPTLTVEDVAKRVEAARATIK